MKKIEVFEIERFTSGRNKGRIKSETEFGNGYLLLTERGTRKGLVLLVPQYDGECYCFQILDLNARHTKAFIESDNKWFVNMGRGGIEPMLKSLRSFIKKDKKRKLPRMLLGGKGPSYWCGKTLTV